jgi:hypothetical protein
LFSDKYKTCNVKLVGASYNNIVNLKQYEVLIHTLFYNCGTKLNSKYSFENFPSEGGEQRWVR